MIHSRVRNTHRMIALALGLFVVLGLAVLPALSSPALPSLTIHMPTADNPGSWTPILALLAGIVILLVPKVFQYIVAVYLILIGLVGLWGR